MSIQHKLLRASGSASKCRTVDVCDIFGDNSGKALYRLDGNANDESGNYHGTETAITYGGGVYERGAVFNGTSSKITSSLVSMGTSNAVSFYINTATTVNQGFIEYSNGTNLIAIYHTSTTLAIRVNALLYTVTTTLPKSAFNHIAVSFSTDVPTMYLNNSLVTLGSVGATAIVGTTGLRVGVANVATVQTYTNGGLDQVRIFNRAITATEVATLYAECAPTSTLGSTTATSIVSNTNPFNDNSLKAMYQFENNVNDLTGTFDGTASNITYATGKFSNAAVFNGSTSAITIPQTIISNTSDNTAFTLSIWVNFASLPTATYSKYAIGSPALNAAVTKLSFGEQAGIYYIHTARSYSGITYYHSTLGVPVGLVNSTWYHFCVVYNIGNTVTIYRNGVAVATNLSLSLTEAASTVNTTLALGQYINNGSYPSNSWNGSQDQFRIFDRALTLNEIHNIYTESIFTDSTGNNEINPFLDGSLQALFKFDNTVTDTTGNYVGTATNVSYGTGKFGQCLTCDGTLRYVTTTYPTYPKTKNTISLWLKYASGTTTHVMASTAYDAGNMMLLGVGIGTVGSLSFQTRSAEGTKDVFIATTTTLGVGWNHIAVVYNGAKVVTYLNGTPITTLAIVYTADIGTAIRLGTSPTLAENWNGSIDQFRIFNKALTPMEVASICNETTPLEEPMYKQTDPFKDISGKVLYRLEGNALDESGGFNGTAVNITYASTTVGREAVFGGNSSVSVALPLSINKFSYSLWATVTTVGIAAQSLIDFSTGRAMLASGDGVNTYLVYFDGAAYRSFGAYSLISGVKTHIGLAVNGASVELFINGVSKGTSVCNSLSPSGNLYLGRYAGSAAGYLTGKEDQVRIFTRVLTALEFQTIYTEGA